MVTIPVHNIIRFKFCGKCGKKVSLDNDKYLMISVESGLNNTSVTQPYHLECYQSLVKDLISFEILNDEAVN